VFTSDSALRESWLKHDYSEHAWTKHSIMIRPNTFKLADGCGAQKNQNSGYYEVKCLAEIWADKEIQQQLSAMGRKQNIWENISAKLNDKCEYHEAA